MKRFFALGLLLLYMGSYTEFHELLRLPLLVEHFIEHRAQVSDMTFFEFLAMHYETDVAHDETDNSLPFKEQGCHCCTSPVVALPMQKTTLLESGFITCVQHASFYQEVNISSSNRDIFQPPRIR